MIEEIKLLYQSALELKIAGKCPDAIAEFR
jgi:hypothetical protein